ncbi:phosphinothricin N-acetyltransferase [Streptomyces noursei ATCC 11455]|nr:phosphinothricin N-acetyltransferase [Streptomyces noursei ATCC 11455]
MPPEHGDVQVRAGAETDLTALTDLYNHYVRETAITFDTAPFSPAQRRPWLLSHPKDGPHRLLVAQGADGDLLGYATSSAFRPKGAYATSVETTVYCAPDAAGRGVGTLLYTALFAALADEDVHRAYAGITQPNGGGTSRALEAWGSPADCTPASVSARSARSRRWAGNSAATGTSPGTRRICGSADG